MKQKFDERKKSKNNCRQQCGGSSTSNSS